MEETSADWVVENLLERGDRLIITGYEGLGKTTWIRQIMICAAAGINPSTFNHIEPIPGLVIDVENSERQLRQETAGIARVAATHARSPGTHSSSIVGSVWVCEKTKYLDSFTESSTNTNF